MNNELTPHQKGLSARLKTGCPLINVELSGSLHGFTPMLTDHYAAQADKHSSGGMER